MLEPNRNLHQFFEAAARAETDEGTVPTFGEYLVEVGRLNRYQLLQALQVQDHSPASRLGDCIAALGFLPHPEIEALHVGYAGAGSAPIVVRRSASTRARTVDG
jgi:hypothetical protein